MKFKKYPANWESMREAMFQAYGGKHCTEGIFKNLGHKGYIHLHHYVSLSKSKNKTEYYFLNQPWNLIPCCEKHHSKIHRHMKGIKGKYKTKKYPKDKKVSYLRRAGWTIKRQHYKSIFNNRKSKRVLNFWNYWNFGKKRLRNEMNNWPDKYLEDLV